ncbi:MAG: NEW3 domain-containing protein [Candidatus Micrarchaeota archaeon]|nr:NEW3 domain-containing protein [Candidatus Micrarchaeota archaeon]
METESFGKMLGFAALLALVLAAPAAAVGPDVRVMSADFSNALGPGSAANLTLVLENLGVFPCAYKVTTQLQAISPVSIDGFDSRIVEKLCQPDNATMTFSIKIDPNAAAAAYPIILVTTYESEYRAAYAATNTVYARVAGSPELTAHVTKTTPVSVYPGGDFSLDAAIDNVGAFRADSLTLSLSAEAPMEVKASTATQSAATLQPRASVTRTFSLHVPKNAAAKTYALNLAAKYLDDNGAWKTKSIPLAVVVSPKARFETIDGASTALIDSRNNELKFKLKNTGTDTALRVRAKLLPAFPFSTQGSVQYIEEMRPGAEKQLVFYADVDKDGVPGEYSLDVSVAFENADGETFTDTIPVGAKTAYTPLVNAIFLNYWYVWAVAIAAALYLASKRLKTRGKSK